MTTRDSLPKRTLKGQEQRASDASSPSSSSDAAAACYLRLDLRQGINYAGQRGGHGKDIPIASSGARHQRLCELSVTRSQNVLEEMFQEADADKDGRIRLCI